MVDVNQEMFKLKVFTKITDNRPVVWNMNCQTIAMATIDNTTGIKIMDCKRFLNRSNLLVRATDNQNDIKTMITTFKKVKCKVVR